MNFFLNLEKSTTIWSFLGGHYQINKQRPFFTSHNIRKRDSIAVRLMMSIMKPIW